MSAQFMNSRPSRRQEDLDRIRGSGPAVLLITHSRGGGTERHIQDLAARIEEEGARALALRSSTKDRLWRLERTLTPQLTNLVFDPKREFYTTLAVLEHAGVAHLHLHHLLDHPPATRRLLNEMALPYDVTLHDYFFVCPRVHLMQEPGQYCGAPEPADCNRCLIRHGHYVSDWDTLEINDWRKVNHADVLAGARRVFAPDPDVQARYQRYHPTLTTHLRPHFDRHPSPRVVAKHRTPGEAIRVVLLGTLQPWKGSHILASLAADAVARQLPLEFHVLGTMDPIPDPLPRTLVMAGNYTDATVYDRLAEVGPHLGLFPSTIPETYCYTLSTALAAGLYCVGLDIGAVGQRLKNTNQGEALPIGINPAMINDRLLQLAQTEGKARAFDPPTPDWRGVYPKLFNDYYELTEFVPG